MEIHFYVMVIMCSRSGNDCTFFKFFNDDDVVPRRQEVLNFSRFVSLRWVCGCNLVVLTDMDLNAFHKPEISRCIC